MEALRDTCDAPGDASVSGGGGNAAHSILNETSFSSMTLTIFLHFLVDDDDKETETEVGRWYQESWEENFPDDIKTKVTFLEIYMHLDAILLRPISF